MTIFRQYLQDRQADLHQIFQYDGSGLQQKSLSFSFWTSGVGAGFENVTFLAVPSPNWMKFYEIEYGGSTKLLIKKQAVWFWPDSVSTERWKPRENPSTKIRDPFGSFVIDKRNASMWFAWF